MIEYLKSKDSTLSWNRRRAIVVTLTLLLLAMHGPHSWYVRSPLVVFAVLGLAWPPLNRSGPFWIAIASMIGSMLLYEYQHHDNHKFLQFYLCLSLALAAYLSSSARRDDYLAFTAAFLIAFPMLASVVWKVANPGFLNGDFFYFELLSDGRFRFLAHWVGGIPLEHLAANQEAFVLLEKAHLKSEPLFEVSLIGTPALRTLGDFMAWWTLLIESVVGLGFLVVMFWRTKLSEGIAHGSLLLFLATTYFLAPVTGFGWNLAILAIIQVRSKLLIWAYLAAIGLIEMYSMPIQGVLDTVLFG